jgi:hypothetical protein
MELGIVVLPTLRFKISIIVITLPDGIRYCDLAYT